MAGLRWSLLLTFSVCCFAVPFQGEDVVVASVNDVNFKTWVDGQSVSASAETAAISTTDLPVARPGQGLPYKYCTLSSCAASVTVRAKGGAEPNHNLTHGLVHVDIRYKAIRGVNSTMMTWMFENLAGKAVYAPTNETFDMYLIFHPRDHIYHTVKKINGQIRPRSKITWCEMILSNCNYNKQSATEPWVCPPKAQGFVRSDPEASWEKKYKTQETFVVNRFNSKGIEFSRVEVNSLLGPEPRILATTRHDWADNAAGTALRLRTQLWIGLMAVGQKRIFDDSSFSGLVNGFVADQIMGGTSDLGSKNATALGYMNALHFVEEYGGTASWLPAVWRARKS